MGVGVERIDGMYVLKLAALCGRGILCWILSTLYTINHTYCYHYYKGEIRRTEWLVLPFCGIYNQVKPEA